MKKTFIIFLTLITIILTTTGCSKNPFQIKAPSEEETLTSATEEVTASSIDMSYSLFNGYRSKIIDLDQCETCEISMNVVSSSGDLNMLILNTDGQVVYEETSIPTSSFSLSLAGGDRYTIKLTALNHVGSFTINFIVNE